MRFADYTKRLLALAETLHRWMAALAALDGARREKVAGYANEIAETLARAAEAYLRLEADPKDRAAARALTRELGRISGYIETLVDVLRHHLDGRKLSGVIRRLEQLGPANARLAVTADVARIEGERLVAAEGYFRALADRLKV